jgi:hypothetical protein
MVSLKRIEGVQELRAVFAKKIAEVIKDAHPSVIVGYTANYAIWIHENTKMSWKGLPRKEPHKGKYWDPQGRGQNKFLEKPARELQFELGYMIAKGVAAGMKPIQAIYVAALRLKRESQRLVPVDFGFLKGSAFVKKE